MEIVLSLLVMVLFVVLVINVTGNLGPSARSLRRLEHKFDLLIEHLGVADDGTAGLDDGTLARIDAYLDEGLLREAARTYGQESGADRREARAWTEHRARAAQAAMPRQDP